MRNVSNWLKQHFKAVIAYTIGIIAGVLLACLNNGIRQDLTYQQVAAEVNNNWILISVTFAVMLGMIITGFYMGKMYEKKKENDIF
jgi:uncharacterized membrane protein